MIPARTISGPGLAELLTDDGPSEAVALASRRHPLARHTHAGLSVWGTALAQALADTEGEPFARPRDTTLTDPLPRLALQELEQLAGLVEALRALPWEERLGLADEAVTRWRGLGATLRALRAEAVGS